MARTRRSRNVNRNPKRKLYSAEALENAVSEARRTGKLRKAAKLYDIPYATVYRYLKHPPRNDRPGPSTLLRPEEEARFEQWALYMARAGFPISEADLTYTVKDYAAKNRETRDLPASFPSKNWVRRFLQRHPSIKKKFTTNLSRSGANVTENILRMWFSEIEDIFEEEGIDMSIFNSPSRIFNFDESGFRLVPKSFKALCDNNTENTYIVNNNSDKESYTSLFGANAAGELTPPMILFPGQRISREIAESIPKGWSVGVSEEGWQTSKTFYEYMVNDYYNWLLKSKIELPVVVFLDGHKSHISIELMEFCKQHQIILASLYPNSTRILQPLDRSFFGPFKNIWNKVLKKFQLGDASNSTHDSGDCLVEPEASSAHSDSLNPASKDNLMENVTVETTGASDTNPKDPFEEVLVWPRIRTDVPNQRKRRGQEHVPSVSTSDRWLQWFEKKDMEKKEIEDAKKARIAERKNKKKQRDEEKLLKASLQKNQQRKGRGKAKQKVACSDKVANAS
ncbi:uncharacterized protein LOC128732342 [Sabethes cyaneus]|uniref:uncharacterized protein LOC128732342 n=1 Tax=Sabethes cyaneus TaxID=53552 RepID=UPI00237E1C27|nr:uncharacterized protein LOC128732342 [Sabethes cyaneus]